MGFWSALAIGASIASGASGIVGVIAGNKAAEEQEECRYQAYKNRLFHEIAEESSKKEEEES